MRKIGIIRRASQRTEDWPDGWQAVLVLFAFQQAFKYGFIPNLFNRFEVFQVLGAAGVGQRVWAAALFAYACVSAFFLFSDRPAVRAYIAIVGAAMWIYLGVVTVAGAVDSGDWRDSGPFMLIAGVGTATVAVHWRRRKPPG